KDAAFFRAIADAEACNLVRRKRNGLDTVDHDRTAAAPDQSEDRLQRRRPAGAIAAKQRHDLATVYRQIDAVQDVRLAVEHVQAADAQEFDAVSHARPVARYPRCPCMPRAPADWSRRADRVPRR